MQEPEISYLQIYGCQQEDLVSAILALATIVQENNAVSSQRTKHLKGMGPAVVSNTSEGPGAPQGGSAAVPSGTVESPLLLKSWAIPGIR